MYLSEFTDGLCVLCWACLQCAVPEGQPEVRAKGFFPELPGGSLCFSCCASPWRAVTNICCKCFRAMPQVAASAPGEWGTAPQIHQMGSKQTITILCREVCSALGTCGHCQCNSVCTDVFHFSYRWLDL